MKIITLLTFSLFFFFSSIAQAGYFDKPEASPVFMHLAGTLHISGQEAESGDELALFDGSGRIVGLFVVTEEGLFGDMPVSGDSELTEESEGSYEGEPLTVKVWQALTDKEFSGPSISLYLPEAGEAIYEPFTGDQLSFEADKFYLLNIEATD